jgi:antitoxin component YwqK of YwqJK toxin-antitoxin module
MLRVLTIRTATLFMLLGLNSYCSAENRTVRTFWDDNNANIKEIKIFDEDHRQTGEWISWYQNGQMRSKTSFLHGIPLMFESWYDNGQKEMQEPCADGLAHGLWIWWAPNGKERARSFFTMGTGIEYYFNEEGHVRTKIIWISGVRVGDAMAISLGEPTRASILPSSRPSEKQPVKEK